MKQVVIENPILNSLFGDPICHFKFDAEKENARQPKPIDVFWKDLCFETRQAIEKTLKDVYQRRGLLFEFVRNIDELARGLELAAYGFPRRRGRRLN